MDKIGVFCSAANNLSSAYVDCAKALGTWMGQNHKTLVYGGSYLGLMGEVGKACHENGGKLFGMVPKSLTENGWEEPELDINMPCEGLMDRKDLMILNSDIMVALPGGVGTLDEVFTAMGMMSLGEIDKKVVFLNINDFWKPVIAFLEDLYQKGFMRHKPAFYFKVANTVEELISILEA